MIPKTETINERFERLARRLEVTVEELRGGCRRQELVDARCMVAAQLVELPGVRQQDVADLFCVSQAAVSKMLVRHGNLMEVDSGYRRRVYGLVKS